MKYFEAKMRVIHVETWTVEAADAAEAREKFEKLSEDVLTDEAGEVIDWEVRTLAEIEEDE